MIITADSNNRQQPRLDFELVVNLHMHTAYSDGTGSHEDIAIAGLNAGLDVVIVTDHNIYVTGKEGYLNANGRKLMLLVGQEIHDPARKPQKNHLLAIGTESDLATYAPEPQQLINRIGEAGGLSFIAHPYDPALPAFDEDDISWVDWSVSGFTGIELWNGLSELKMVAHQKWQALIYALFPQLIANAPAPQVVSAWEALLKAGRVVVAVGGSDAHALSMSMGPFHRTIFPYDFHFRAINTHILVPESLSGELEKDKETVYQALQKGHAFIGYDLPHPTRGFRFSAQTMNGAGTMGDTVYLTGSSVTFQVTLPSPCECKLIRAGQGPLPCKPAGRYLTHITNIPGAYRVECWIDYLGKKRAWIISNPIYVRE